jgi:hypothetical protein
MVIQSQQGRVQSVRGSSARWGGSSTGMGMVSGAGRGDISDQGSWFPYPLMVEGGHTEPYLYDHQGRIVHRRAGFLGGYG